MAKPLEGRSRTRVVVVDDDPDMLLLFSTLPEHKGYEIFRAADGEACLPLVSRHQPPITLADDLPPGMNGLEIIPAPGVSR